MNIEPKALGAALGGAVKRLLDPIRARIKTLEALEARVTALERSVEQRSYHGVHDAARTYLRHNLVTKGGSLWIALKDTYAVPGESADWQLAVKRGRNGKDATREA